MSVRSARGNPGHWLGLFALLAALGCSQEREPGSDGGRPPASRGGPAAAPDPQIGEPEDRVRDCCHPAPGALFATAESSPPIVERRADGTIVTRGAGRVRGRHELEGMHAPFGERYFEN